MLRSISFVIEGLVTTQVRVTGNLDGTLSFEFTRRGAGSIGDLGAVFLDLNRSFDGGGFKVFGDAGLSLGACVDEGIDTLGRKATLTRRAVDALGDFDIGVAFGPVDRDRGAPRSTGFTLAHDTASLTLDMIDLVDFALRYAAPGADSGDLSGRHDFGVVAEAARWDVLEVIETHAVRARPLADDAKGGVLAVIDLLGARETFAVCKGDLDGDLDGWGRPLDGVGVRPALVDRGT